MTKLIPLLQGKALLIELPEGVSNPRIWPESPDRLYVDDPLGYDGVDQVDLPPGNWRIVSMLSEISEEQANGLVEKVMNGQHYQNYNYKSVAERWVKTALESFHSAIKAEGWYLENPYGATAPNGVLEGDFNKYLDWADAQQRVLDPERTLVIERI